MEIETLVKILDDTKHSQAWLRPLRVENVERAHDDLIRISKSGLTLDLMAIVCGQLAECLPEVSDADMALNNLERFFGVARNPLALGSLFERDPAALPTLMQIFSSSQYLSDLMVRDPESYDLLRLTEGHPVARELLIEEVCAAVENVDDERLVMPILRRYKQRETLRIAYGDIIRGMPIETVTKQISSLADAICEAALRVARKIEEAKRGVPRRSDGQPARFVALALGKMGGNELNYSSDIDLVLLRDDGGKTDGERSISNEEFFDRVARRMVKLLSEVTDLGFAYRVDLRLRPEGQHGATVIAITPALQYYDISGRTWERQAFVKARAAAGDLDLGCQFLEQLEPWIYRRYLNRADITGIKALKRRIEHRTSSEGEDASNVKTGHGGIRDIEFVIQFLQLLNGGDLPQIRTGNTLAAIASLEQVGCLTMQERSILEQGYEMLRKLEHRLQIMFDLQTHTLPDSDIELRRIAIRMGYRTSDEKSALETFKDALSETTNLNRKILDHLLHDAFGEEEQAEPSVDLVLDPDPSSEQIQECLGPFGFHDIPSAYQNLMDLSEERIRFLSPRRCRHFLASISPALLQSISKTPDPDSTLVNLSKVSDSLGGKGVLWELFSFNEPSLQLYVQICASSPYLAGILTSNPGMIDELMDSLVLDKLPTLQSLESTLADLCRGAEEVEPILHSFKNSHHLRVGVRDILRKEDVKDTHRALSDIAETCLRMVANIEYERLAAKFGQPTIAGGALDGKRCEMVILAMGKLGGREPNYHSDLDVIFLFEGDGNTQHDRRSDRGQTTTNQHFFSQLAQRITSFVSRLGPHGRLYELDPRLRPTGKNGALACSLNEFARYFAEGQGQLWERQALCKARPVTGSPESQESAMQVVRDVITSQPWQPEFAAEIKQMRARMEETASKRNLKRGPGGTVDLEFIVQMLQLKHVADDPEVITPGTLDAASALHEAGHLSDDDYAYVNHAYRFLRSIEAGLRLMNTSARHDLPSDEHELKKLAFLLGLNGPDTLVEKCERYAQQNRERFNQLFDQAAAYV